MLLKKEYYLLPLQDSIVFPDCMTVLSVVRKNNIINIENTYLKNEKILCVAQKNKLNENIKSEEDLFSIGVLCDIVQKIQLPSGELRLFVKGLEKLKIEKVTKNEEGCLFCLAKGIKDTIIKENQEELEKTKSIVLKKADFLIKSKLKADFDLPFIFKKLEKNIDIIYIITNLLNVDINAKQSILEERTELGKFTKINQFLEIEKALFDTEAELNQKIDKKIQNHQKNYFLKEKLKLIKNELKDTDLDDVDDKSESALLKKKAKGIKLSKNAKEKFDDEINKLETIPSYSPEYSTIKNFLDYLISLPWGKKTKLKNSLKEAENILNHYHYGLDDVKERIIEFIAVLKNTKKINGPIMCLVGPPGIGKTSLAKSIAEATNREYIKISLGGVRDEAEIRGHRKTYVGSMPGKIIQSIKKAKVDNPLILLDEIDKMNSDLRGDPTSALLEVLDPEQNKSFNDHFMEIEYDLSDTLFLATANSLHNIPYPLQDRMEIIKLTGYTEDEKITIANNFLIPKLLKMHNLKKNQVLLNDDVILEVIKKHTLEAGVRNLERSLETIIRKITRKIVENDKIKSVEVDKKNLKDFLGVDKYSFNSSYKEDRVSVSTAMAYTEMGGDLLYIEVLKFEGSGKLNITGKLGDVMKESAQAAFSYVRSKASEMGVCPKKFNKFDFHLHVPEGATPKDGPSAGVAISVALMSSLIDLKIRSDTSMTGEITLTGEVLPIGGLKEKLLAALRGQIKNVLIPKENVKDLEKLPEKVKTELNIIPIENIEEAFNFVLIGYSKNKKIK